MWEEPNSSETQFNEANAVRQNQLQLQPRVFQEFLLFMDHYIRKQLKSFTLLSICGSERKKFMVDPTFQRAFKQLPLHHQIALYHKAVTFALQAQNTHKKDLHESKINIEYEEEDKNEKQRASFRVQIEKGFHSWSQTYFSLEGFKLNWQASPKIDLRNYLIRQSKKTDRECYVLEAIKQSNPATLRFSFLTNDDRKRYFPCLENRIEMGFRQSIERMVIFERSSIPSRISYEVIPVVRKFIMKDIQIAQKRQVQEKQEQSDLPLESPLRKRGLGKSILTQKRQSPIMIEIPSLSFEQPQVIKNLSILTQEKQHEDLPESITLPIIPTVSHQPNILIAIVPKYNISNSQNIDQYVHLEQVSSSNLLIYQHLSNKELFKAIIFLPNKSPEAVCRFLTCCSSHWNPQILQYTVNLRITADNCIIAHQRHSAYSKWYYERDFLFLRHLCKLNNSYIIADKKIQHADWSQKSGCQRGQIIQQIHTISSHQGGTKVILDCQYRHGGLLNKKKQSDLTIRYLQGYSKLNEKISSEVAYEHDIFNFNWQIAQTNLSPIGIGSVVASTTGNSLEPSFQISQEIADTDIFFSIVDDQQESNELKWSQHQIEESEQHQHSD